MNRKREQAISPDMLRGKTAFITLASEGIGLEAARLFAMAGANIAVNVEKGEEEGLKALLSGTNHVIFSADLSDEDQCKRVMEETAAKLGPASIVVYNSPLFEGGDLEDITASAWDDMMHKKLRAAFLLSRAAAPGMKSLKHGKIILVSSAAAKVGGRVMGAGVHYVTASCAIMGLARGLAMELAPFGINVNSVCPGMVEGALPASEMEALGDSYPVRRFADPTEVAGGILFLASNYSDWMAGYSLDMNGGLYMD